MTFQGITNANGMPIHSFMAQTVRATDPTDQEGVKYSTHQPEFRQYAMYLKVKNYGEFLLKSYIVCANL